MRGWGSTESERNATLAGDELSLNAAVVGTRAIDIAAPPDAVWPLLLQIGQDRSGFFSYTFLENLIGCQMPRVHQIRDEWQTRRPGDKMLMASPTRFGGKAYNVIQQVIPGRALVAVGPTDRERIGTGSEATWVWQFVAHEEAPGHCRLIVRSRYLKPQRWLEPIHFMMERRMMLTIARLAERESGATQDESGTVGLLSAAANAHAMGCADDNEEE